MTKKQILLKYGNDKTKGWVHLILHRGYIEPGHSPLLWTVIQLLVYYYTVVSLYDNAHCSGAAGIKQDLTSTTMSPSIYLCLESATAYNLCFNSNRLPLSTSGPIRFLIKEQEVH